MPSHTQAVTDLLPLVVSSAAMIALLDAADRAALSDGKVLITGESGVGKDLIARRIHALSRRSAHSLVPVNCAGLTESLLESELFGHVKGSFTGAYRDKLGKLQAAHGGTIFLDEVGEMSLRMQAMLLRFLENGEIQAVGSDRRLTTVNVRVIAATNRNLADLIAAGQFREDLLYRLRVIHLEVPPLRNRTEEIPALVSHFVARTHRRVSFTDEAMQVLARYRWPGNVRELQNVVEQATWLATGEVVDVAQLPEGLRVSSQPVRATRERRAQIADELYAGLVSGGTRSGITSIRCFCRATLLVMTCASWCGKGSRRLVATTGRFSSCSACRARTTSDSSTFSRRTSAVRIFGRFDTARPRPSDHRV